MEQTNPEVIKEGERFQLPGINRQVETRRGENQPLAISRRAGFFKKLIAAELMQVEVAEVLHRHERNFDPAKLRIGPGRHDVLLAGFPVDHPVDVPFAHLAHRRILDEATHDGGHAFLHQRPPEPLEGRIENLTRQSAD